MSGMKTPKGNLGEDFDEIEEIFQDTPVEVNLKAGSSTKRDRATILNFLFKWTGVLCANSKFLRMNPAMNSEQQWGKWYKGLLGFFESQVFVGEFFLLGKFQCPMEVVEVDVLDKELPTKRSLADTFNQMAAMASSVKDSAEKKVKKGGKEDAKEVKESIVEEPSTKCLIFEHHPIFEMCDISENMKAMKAAKNSM